MRLGAIALQPVQASESAGPSGVASLQPHVAEASLPQHSAFASGSQQAASRSGAQHDGERRSSGAC
jgi:hypothetical protein